MVQSLPWLNHRTYLCITTRTVWHHSHRTKIWGCSRQPLSQNRGPSEGVQMAAASSLSQEWQCHHLSCVAQQAFFSIGCFRCWTEQPRPRARTSARCIMGDYLSIPPCPASSKYSQCFLRRLPLPSFSPLARSGRLLCCCSCLFVPRVKKRGRGWKWREEQVCRLSDGFALAPAQCASVDENNPTGGQRRGDKQYAHAASERRAGEGNYRVQKSVFAISTRTKAWLEPV